MNDKEADFPNVTDYLPQGIRVINTDYKVKYINPSFAKLSGVKKEDAIGKKCYDVFPSKFCHTSDCRLVRIIKGEKSVQTETERVSNEGSIIPCMVSAFPMYDEENNLIGIMESFRDISDRKLLEEQVKEAEDRYKAMVELSNEAGEGIMMLEDVDGREGVIVFANSQCSRLTGYTNDELIGEGAFELVADDDRKAALERYRRKMKGESLPGPYEEHIICKDGAWLPVELTGTSTQYRGKTVNVVYMRDISKRKLLEKQLANERDKANSYLDIAKVMIIALDSNYKITLINQEGCNVLEYSTSKALIGKSVFETYVPIEFRDEVKVILDMVLNGHLGPDKWNENPAVTKNGSYKLIRWYDAPIVDKSGNIVGILASGHDVTLLRKTEKELLDYQQHLEGLVKNRTDSLEREIEQRIFFTRAMVHELKTPLTAILSSSEVLVNELAGSVLLPAASNIYRGGVNLNRRITDLLDLAKSEINVLNVDLRPLDPISLLTSVEKKIASIINKKEQRLVTETPDELPLILGDEDRIQQVLFNLLINAIKYNRKYGKIVLRASYNKSSVIFEITDEGIGIGIDEQKRLFNPYCRIESDKERFNGLGIGLALSKSLVELQNGSIWINSEKGKGCTFAFSIPKYKLKEERSSYEPNTKNTNH